MSKAFKVTNKTSVIPDGQTTLTLTAGVDYPVPSSLEHVSFELTNSRLSGNGRTAGGGNQNTYDFTVRIDNPENILTEINLVRVGSTNDCRVTWQVTEYVGQSGGDNEFIVRDRGIVSGTSTLSVSGSAVSGITNNNKVEVRITSQSGNDTGRVDMHVCAWTSSLSGNTPQFDRLGTAIADTAWISYEVIEWIGTNWRDVQRIETTALDVAWTSASDAGPGYTVPISTPLLDVEKTFIKVQFATSHDGTGLDDIGQVATIDSITNLRLWTRNALPTRRTVVWLIENTQSSSSVRNMFVQHDVFFRSGGGPEERVETRTLPTAAGALDEISICGSTGCDGTGTAFPRGYVDFLITGLDTYTYTTSDSGQENHHAVEFIQWPEDDTSEPGSDTILPIFAQLLLN